ncbi:MAG: hypothetical protein QM723_16695 [Myxococcaceae bacterium]
MRLNALGWCVVGAFAALSGCTCIDPNEFQNYNGGCDGGNCAAGGGAATGGGGAATGGGGAATGGGGAATGGGGAATGGGGAATGGGGAATGGGGAATGGGGAATGGGGAATGGGGAATGGGGAATGGGGAATGGGGAATGGGGAGTFNVTVTTSGDGTGTVTSSPTGINCPGTCTAAFAPNTTVTLTATATGTSTFTKWSTCAGTGTCDITVIGDTMEDAAFLANYPLTVTPGGTGTGSVTDNTGQIICGGLAAMCSGNYLSGTMVTLTASADPNSDFAGWSGGGCSGTGQCVVPMNMAQTVNPTFTLKSWQLTVQLGGNGSGSVSSVPSGIACGSTCNAMYTDGTMVTLTPAISTGSSFTGWGGACSGTGACVVAMTQAQTVTASFTLKQYVLTVTTTGPAGAGTVTGSPGSISCPGIQCSQTFNYGSAVTLTASPTVGNTLSAWSGGGCTGNGVCNLTMTADTTVNAAFAIQTFNLQLATTGNGVGTVTPNPVGTSCGTGCYTYNYSTTVAVTQSASGATATLSQFGGWSGDCTGNGTCSLAMFASRSVSARFNMVPNFAFVTSTQPNGNMGGFLAQTRFARRERSLAASLVPTRRGCPVRP